MSDDSAAARIMMLVPSPDVAAAATFYETVLGLPLMFRDGERFAGLRLPAKATLGVSSVEESLVAQPVLAYGVGNVESAIERALALGATVTVPPQDGPHERRAALRDPWGNGFVVFAPLG